MTGSAFAVALAVLVVLGWSQTAEGRVDPCDTHGVFVVDTPEKAAVVADGYANRNCTLIIRTRVAPVVRRLRITARAIFIEGPDVERPTERVAIVNATRGGGVELTAVDRIVASQAVLLGDDRVTLTCLGAHCPVELEDSAIAAAAGLSFDSPRGDLRIAAAGAVSARGSTVWGGRLLDIRGRTMALACAPPFRCGGGARDISIRTAADIDLAGSVLTGRGRLALAATRGAVRGADADVEGRDVTISAFGAAQLRSARVAAERRLRLHATGCPAAPAVCIDAEDSTLLAGPGPGPCLGDCRKQGPWWSDPWPPHPNLASCPSMPPFVAEPADIVITALPNGRVSLCGAFLGRRP